MAGSFFISARRRGISAASAGLHAAGKRRQRHWTIRCPGCACGQAFHGQTTTKQKRRLSGEPVRTAYYVCSGYLQKGRAKCVRFLIPKEEMEAIIWRKVGLRLEALCTDGEELAARMMERTTAGADPTVEVQLLSEHSEATHRKIPAPLKVMRGGGASVVRDKLDDPADERGKCERDLARREGSESPFGFDAKVLAVELRAYQTTFQHVREVGNLEQKKAFLRGLIDRIEITPSTSRASLTWLSIPRPASH